MLSKLTRLESRLAHIQWQIRGYDQMIMDEKYWGFAGVAHAREMRVATLRARDHLSQQITELEILETARAGPLNS